MRVLSNTGVSEAYREFSAPHSRAINPGRKHLALRSPPNAVELESYG